MNKITLFYRGSGENSRSFYIQPSPMRETTINYGYNELQYVEYVHTNHVEMDSSNPRNK